MIVSIKGKIIEKNIKNVVIQTGGLGYLCHISSNTYDKLTNIETKVFLLIYHQKIFKNYSRKRPQLCLM